MSEIFIGTILRQWKRFYVHIEQWLNHFRITGMVHGPVDEPCILKPEVPAPVAVIGIIAFFAIPHILMQMGGEDRSVEFDRQCTSSCAGIHVALQHISLGDAKGGIWLLFTFHDQVMPVPE